VTARPPNPRPDPGPAPVKPNFLIVGAARSGTTALARTLAQHPDVFITEPKEVHFLAHADEPVTYTGPGDDQMINRSMVTDVDTYYRLFDGGAGAKARGEGSVSTLYHAHRSIPAIDKYAERDTNVIAILREPTARALSAYHYLRARGFEPAERFDQALALEPERHAVGYHHLWHLRAMSRYRDQLPLFAGHFGLRLHIIIQEEYRRSPDDHLYDLTRFLGIDPTFRFSTDLDVNRGGEPRSKLVARTLSALRSSPVAASAVKRVTPASMRERIRAANLRAVGRPAGFGRLWDEFAPDRLVVEELLGRPIPDWDRP
jgi:hypothetical protein